MSFLRKEPGIVFAAIFLVMGITFVAAVSAGEMVAPVAGQGFDDGLVNGAGWHDGEFPTVEMN